MRKTFTLLIALLALTVSSWAQTGVQIGNFYYQLGTQGNYKFANVMKLPGTEAQQFVSYGSSVSGNVVIPATVEYNAEVYEVSGILEYAFVGCSDITSVTIEEGVTSVDNHAFLDCSSLTTVTLPFSIMDLGDQAFSNTGLNTITIKATTPPTYGLSLFSDSEGLAHIYVPAASVEAYKAAEGWSAHADIIAAIPAAPASDGTITWEARQVSHVLLDCRDNVTTQSTHVIKNIITTLENKNASANCSFYEGTVILEYTGEEHDQISFQSIVGDLTEIVITCNAVASATDLSTGWNYDDDKTITWNGSASESVTLSGNLNFSTESIEFTYTPVSAPHLGQTFTGSYGQTYEITGLHTAKVIPQSIFGTLDIPDYEVYDYETYYITEIDDYAFSTTDNDIANAYIGANVAKIGAHAFENNIHMTEVFVRSTVLDAIGEEAFKNCLLLHGFECYTNMPPALGNDAFEGDTRINRIAVSNPYDYQDADGWLSYAAKIKGSWIAPEAEEIFFYDNQTTVNLYAVVAGATYNTRGQAKVMPYTSDVNAIYPITRTGTLIIPEEVIYMGRPYDVTGIGANAYKDCADVNVVMIPQQMTSIEAGAFSGCMGIKNVFFLWNDPTSITWADRSVGAEFATAVSGNTKIFVPEGTLTAYQTWAPAWASCMYEGEILDVTAAAPDAEDTEHIGRFYRTFYDSSSDYMLPPSVWAHVGYVRNNEFILRPIAFDGEIIPKGTAVVLESETPSYRLIAVPGDAPAYTGQNDLRGTDVDLAVSTLGADADKVYVLNREATLGTNRLVGMGMYKYTGSMLGAHKAYLIYDAPAGPNSAPARFVFKHENQATGVENVQSDKVQCTKVIRDGQLIIVKDGKVYNAQGLIIK